MSLDLKLGKIKEIADVGRHGGVFVSFENGMEFIIGGRWMEDQEYDENWNPLNIRRFRVFEKKGSTGFYQSYKYEKELRKVHPEYFREVYKPEEVYGLSYEIEDMVADAVIEYFENVPKDYKGIKIIYTDYVKGQNKQQDKAEEQGSQQISLKQLGEQTQTQSKNENNITSMHTESNSDKKRDLNSLSSSNGMGRN